MPHEGLTPRSQPDALRWPEGHYANIPFDEALFSRLSPPATKVELVAALKTRSLLRSGRQKEIVSAFGDALLAGYPTEEALKKLRDEDEFSLDPRTYFAQMIAREQHVAETIARGRKVAAAQEVTAETLTPPSAVSPINVPRQASTSRRSIPPTQGRPTRRALPEERWDLRQERKGE